MVISHLCAGKNVNFQCHFGFGSNKFSFTEILVEPKKKNLMERIFGWRDHTGWLVPNLMYPYRMMHRLRSDREKCLPGLS